MKFILLYLIVVIKIIAGEKDITEEEFKLISVNKGYYTNSIFESEKEKILIFISPHCKFSIEYLEFIKNVNSNIEKNKIDVYLISPNYPNALTPDDLSYTDTGVKIEDMKLLIERNQISSPYIYDGRNQIITNLYGIKMTPSIVILNSENELIYKGKMGDKTKSGEISVLNIQKLINEHEKNKPIITKVYGTEIKTQTDEKQTAKILKRYSEETVRLTASDSKKLQFFLKFNNKKISLFYVWQTSDKNFRNNLLKVTDIYKRYRKRGLSVTTICLSEEKDKGKILVQLRRAQLSCQNFLSTYYEGRPILDIIGFADEVITPSIICIGDNGEIIFKSRGTIQEKEIKYWIVDFLKSIN